MSGVKSCGTCGSGNAHTSARCWVCGASLDGAGATASVPKPVRDSGDTLQALGWLGLLTGIGFVTMLVAVELWIEWPGLLVPYALVVLIGFAALARTAWLQTRKAPPQARLPPGAVSGQPSASGQPAPPSEPRSLAHDVALGLSIALVVLAGLGLLLVAAVVVFFVICLAVIGGSGGFH